MTAPYSTPGRPLSALVAKEPPPGNKRANFRTKVTGRLRPRPWKNSRPILTEGVIQIERFCSVRHRLNLA